jgi:general secretion pathway protein E
VLANAIHSIVSRRLVRKLSCDCRESYDAEDGTTLFRPTGCSSCADTGYRGRAALYEILTVEDDLAAILRALPRNEPIAARGDRMRDLRADGMRLCRAGVTSVEEVNRVVGLPRDESGE